MVVNAYLPHHIPIHADELGEFAVALVNFAGATPQARRDAHGGEYTVVVEEHALKGFFDEDEVLGGALSMGCGRRALNRAEKHEEGRGEGSDMIENDGRRVCGK